MIDENRDSDSHDIAPHESLRLKFAKDFPKARDIDWELGANIYEVEFEIGRIDYKAYYDADANLLMYKHDITSTALPQVIKNTVSSKYPQYRYDDVEKILRGSEVFYKIELERGESDVKLVVDKKGNILNKYFD